jgi:N6-adenosine-specific RNA methylase IME4
LKTQEICELQIPTSENAVLFLWATNPLLEDALQVMKAWGFQYKTNIVWVKDKFGIGFYVRGQHELLLIGTKGNVHPPEESNRFSSVVNADVKEHSEKPEEIYNLIEAMYPDKTYLELFARKQRLKWKSWGNEV